MDCWYFAYGSNLWRKQMTGRIGWTDRTDHSPRLARLANHRVVFQHLEPGGDAYANILSPGAGVVGIVYRCSPAEMKRLDVYEEGYLRQQISVVDAEGETLDAVVYVVDPVLPARFGRPSAAYLKRVVTGAREHQLPEEYVREIIASAEKGTE